VLRIDPEGVFKEFTILGSIRAHHSLEVWYARPVSMGKISETVRYPQGSEVDGPGERSEFGEGAFQGFLVGAPQPEPEIQKEL